MNVLVSRSASVVDHGQPLFPSTACHSAHSELAGDQYTTTTFGGSHPLAVDELKVRSTMGSSHFQSSSSSYISAKHQIETLGVWE